MAIYEKLNIIQSKLKAPKGQYNSFGKYHYRSCEDILEAVKPILSETKTVLTIGDKIVSIDGRFYIEATATLTDCEDATASITNTALAREDDSKKGMDGSQITGTASSYARKYALNGLFCIDDTKDADTDENARQTGKKEAKAQSKPSPAPQTAPQQASDKMIGVEDIQYINGVIEKYPRLLEQIKNKFKVNAVIDMTAEQGTKCVMMLNAFESAQHPTE